MGGISMGRLGQLNTNVLKIKNRIGLPVTDTSGMDCFERCFNKDHFLNYPKKITYQYNSRGFRDAEWPIDLSDVIWCVGDSFTSGIGQPHEETWPALLEKKTGTRCLNLGEDACSNHKIALRAQEIYKLYKPQLIVVMWSYFSRRTINGKDLQFDKNDFGPKQDLLNFVKNFNIVNSLPTNIVHLLIPGAFIDRNLYPNPKLTLDYIFMKYNIFNNKQYKDILTFPQLDSARDYHHFDIKTSELVCDLIMEKINNFDKTSE